MGRKLIWSVKGGMFAGLALMNLAWVHQAHADKWVPSSEYGQAWRDGRFTMPEGPTVIVPSHHHHGGVITIMPYDGEPTVSVNGYDAWGRCVIPACQVQNRQDDEVNKYHCQQSNDGALSCGYGKDVPPPR